MMIVVVVLVHYDVPHKITPPEEPKVMKVHIETSQNAQVEDVLQRDIQSEIAEDNTISATTSEDFVRKASAHEKLEQYRIDLAVIGRLCMKFLKHENYEEELVFMHKNIDDYPDDIAKLVNELQDYESKYLVSHDEAYTKLNLEGGFATRMVNKIVDIEKKNPQYEVREEEYRKLGSQLDGLMAYFYSKEFLRKYIGND